MARSTVSPDDPTLTPEALGMTPSEVLAPTVVAGRYEILGLLGIGGMGRVYRARDRELGETVALKVLHAELVTSAEMVERFRQEVRLARRVTHRNVARTFDIGEHEGEKFLTMELVDGEPLSAVLERGRLPLGDVLRIAREIVDGVGAAHAVGVVHRDLKPDNVLVERGGRVVVTDFGIARAEAPGAAGQTAGHAIGTPAYMAPEQVGGHAVDGRADVYAFGAMLYEMLTGRRAWPGSQPFAVAAARLVEAPPDPRVARPDLPPALASLVLRCLARERDARFPTATALAQALAEAEVGAEPGIREAPRAAPIDLDVRRERLVAVLPFKNFGPADDASFVEGLTEDLIDALATVRGLRVRGRGYPDPSDRDAADTGRRLGVDVVVEGSARRAGSLLRVSARVIGVADGFSLATVRADRAPGEAFALNDEVASAVARALSTEHAEAPRAKLADARAVELYFRAKHLLSASFTADAVAAARELFREALERAPDDPTLLAGCVIARIGRNFFAQLDSVEAKTLLRRALERGPTMAEPWIALAGVRFNHQDDPGGALLALRHALAFAPSSAEAHDLAGRILLEVDAIEQANAHLDRVLWIDPRLRWARVDRIRSAALVGDWQTARALYESTIDDAWLGHRFVHERRLWSWPGAPPIVRGPFSDTFDPRFRRIASAYDRAVAIREAGGQPSPLSESLAPIREIFASSGPRSRGRRFFLQMTMELALIEGHRAAVLDMLEEAVEAGLLDVAWIRRLKLLDPLRSEPRFVAAERSVAERAERVLARSRGDLETVEEALASLER